MNDEKRYELYKKMNEAEEQYECAGWLSRAADHMLATELRELADRAEDGDTILASDILKLMDKVRWRNKSNEQDCSAAIEASNAKSEYNNYNEQDKGDK